MLCVGLDVHQRFLREPSADAAELYCLDLIERTATAAAAFKVNTAFFEVFGGPGWDALRRVVAAVPDTIPVIVDAKRGDIGSTSEAYAEAVFEGLGADAVTVSPYLGPDAIEPFLRRDDKGVFVLVRTSNPGASLLQDARLMTGAPLYSSVVDQISGPNVGYVIGATAPEALADVRAIAPDAWILSPGIGAQGAELSDAVAAGKRMDGSGLLVPVSRAIAEADDPGVHAEQLRQAIGDVAPGAPTTSLDQLVRGLFEAGCVRFGEFTLKSGDVSPVYVDLRRLAASPPVLAMVAREIGKLIAPLEFAHIAALPYAALPIGTALSLQIGGSLVYPRREPKDYGTRAVVEGVFEAGERAIVVDDLATSGGSKFEAIEKLTSAGLVVTDIAVLIDRQGGAAAALEDAGYAFHSVLTISDLASRLYAMGLITTAQHDAVERYLGE